jgi:thiol-disulfide isomerase/thioredoxin
VFVYALGLHLASAFQVLSTTGVHRPYRSTDSPFAFGSPSVEAHRTTRRSSHVLRAVAEFEEVKKDKDHPMNNNNDNNNEDDDTDSSDSWIPTAGGGFLPRFFGRGSSKELVIAEAETLQDYKRIVVDESQHQMVVVCFYAHWCRACKAVQPMFRKLAREHSFSSSSSLPVKFVRVPLTPTNGFLHDGLGVPSLPYAHIYHPTAGLVEERKINKRVFADFEKVLETYVQGQCDLEDDDDMWRGDGSENTYE